MNAHAQMPEATDEAAGAELVTIETSTALGVLLDAAKFDDLLAKITAATGTLVPDVSTAKGRDEIRAMAMRVVKVKTKIVAAANEFTEEWRKNTAAVVASRKAIAETLDVHRDTVRAPLTAWEKAEEAREDDVKATLARLHEAAVVSIEDTAEAVSARLAEIAAVVIDDAHFQEYAAAARATQTTTIEVLTAAVARLKREAEDAAELARLRQAETDRLAREAEEAAVAEAKAAEEKAAEDQRLADAAAAKAEEDRQAKAAADAKEAADRAATQAAEEARQTETKRAADALAEQERQHQLRMDEQREATQRAEAEAKRLADEEDERQREVKAQADADTARAADLAHRNTVQQAAREAFMEQCGVSAAVAQKIVLAIVAGNVPAVSMKF